MSALRGQITLEFALLTGVAVAALVTMVVYVQRAYQGYLYVNASAQGQQFNPLLPHTQTQTLSLSQTHDINVLAGPVLTTVPASRLLNVQVDATSDWNLTGALRNDTQ